MRQVLAGLLSLLAAAPGYMLGRVVAYLGQGARGGNFFGQFFWEITAGCFAAGASFLMIEWILDERPGKIATHIAVVAVISIPLIGLGAYGFLEGLEHNGSRAAAIGGYLGLPLGFIATSLALRFST